MTLLTVISDPGTITGDSQIVLALIALIATSIAALVYTIKNNNLGKSTAKDAYEANKAVNNIGPGDHRLYDKITSIATEIHSIRRHVDQHQRHWDDFNARWGNLPEELNDGVDLTIMIREIHHSVTAVDAKITVIDAKVAAVATKANVVVNRVADLAGEVGALDEKLTAHIAWANKNYIRSAQARTDIQDDVSTLLDHDDKRDIPGKRYDDPTEGK